MIFGEIVYQLEAVNDGYLPKAHGRFMHAAFFAALRGVSGEIAEYIHDEMNIKPFTVSELQFDKCQNSRNTQELFISTGSRKMWRVTAFSDTILKILAELPIGYVFKVGRMQFKLVDARTVVTNEADFIANCLKAGDIGTISFDFLSPVTFRFFKDDYPMPLPEYIWGSLADKWLQMNMEMPVEKVVIKEIATKVIPIRWSGRSEMVCFDKTRRVNSFIGSFEFSLRNLTQEEKLLVFILAQFSCFSGVGRLTAQGLGQTKVSYK